MEKNIERIMKSQKGEPISFSNIFKKTHLPEKRKNHFSKTIDKMIFEKKLYKIGNKFFISNGENTKGKYSNGGNGNKSGNNNRNNKYIEAEIVRLATRFGFAKPTAGGDDYFIPGRGLLGAMVGDIVNIERKKESFGSSPEAMVREIVKPSEGKIIGILELSDNRYFIHPDKMEIPIFIPKEKIADAQIGDKILATISKRGLSHYDHIAEVKKVYGDGESARLSREAVLDENDISKEFPLEVLYEADIVGNQLVSQDEIKNRVDLRNETIFTIDGADAKDLDDAISIEKSKDMYKLGVHIADVSNYVKARTNLDEEAFFRGTSIYFADQVIPMLPVQLSNGICSLTDKEDRLAFSVHIDIDKNGEILRYNFFKSVINSTVKGVYTEVNSIFDNTAKEDILDKYRDVVDNLFIMKELSDILEIKRKKRGNFDIDSKESRVITDEGGKAVDVVLRESGYGEGMIESFMLTANEAAACFALEKELPFIHRIHENPALTKVTELKEDMKLLGIEVNTDKDGNISHKEFSRLLLESKGTTLEPIISYRLLRTMAKAKYSEKPLGHFGLALEKYVHFTSPIRRYPDLVDHRILSEYLLGGFDETKEKSFSYFVKKAAEQSTDREINAMRIERECEDIYKAEYLNSFLGETFNGIIVSATQNGLFVEVKSAIQGRINTETLPKGNYVLEGSIRLRNTLTKKTYTVGDLVEVVVAKSDVSTGNIDFVLKELFDENKYRYGL